MNRFRSSVLAAFFLLVGCSEDLQKPPRFITEPVLETKVSLIQFSDNHSVRIECIRLAKNGDQSVLWDELLEPLSDGLGARLYVFMEAELKVAGRGEDVFVHSIPDFDVEKIHHATMGRNASLDPSNLVWVCMLEGDLGNASALGVNLMPVEISEIANDCRKNQAEAIVLRASRVLDDSGE